MGFLSALRWSNKKSKEIKRLQKIIGDNNIQAHNVREQAIEDFIDLCMADPYVSKVMNEHKATKDTLHALYRDFISTGAGQWKGGHFVAASALAYAQTLEYCFDALNKGVPIENICYELLQYFKHGKVKMPKVD